MSGVSSRRSFRDDAIVKAAAWISLTSPRKLAARSGLLQGVAGDGYFLTAFPVLALALPVACFVAGATVGAHGWGYELIVTESVFLLSALVALGAFSSQLALLALTGFAAGEFFLRFTAWTYTVINIDFATFLDPSAVTTGVSQGQGILDHGVIANLWRVRLPLLILYLVLGAGGVLAPSLARSLAAAVLAVARVPRSLDWLVASSVYVVAIWFAIIGWVATVPLLIRPIFAWRGGPLASFPPAQATVPIQHFGRQVVAAAVVGAIVRQLVVLAVSRHHGAAARVDVVLALAQPVAEPTPRRRRHPWARAAGGALVAVLFAAGLWERWWTWVLATAVFFAVAALRSELLPPSVLKPWARTVSPTPLLLRIVAFVVLVRLGAGALSGTLVSSFTNVAVFVLVTTFVGALLFPPGKPAATGSPPEEPARP